MNSLAEPRSLKTSIKYRAGIHRVQNTSRRRRRWRKHPNFGTDLLNPDFVAYAEACGAAGIRVDTPEALGPAVGEVILMNVPVVVLASADYLLVRRGKT
ncbi:thiamine pyrophosphate-dependent enzyme [Methanoculleus oceani]|uniref:Thiamine pyrophosphate enzyme TPP-binding domain-containing protein n=1 Tax=Methanoculleus oceani TaxID=2184756 RepID=A0ABD4TB81_9EURY|nr:hypothetical protein [Methanoculleus sp. CWC-02]